MAANGHDTVVLATLAANFPPFRQEGRGYKCKCPIHDDGDPSLELNLADDGRVLAICRAGCPQAQVWAAVKAHIPKRERQAPGRRIVTAYSYTDERGAVLYQAVRYDPKDFKQRQPDGAGGWRWTMAGARYVPYHLPAVIASDEVLVVEGEKDADNLAKLGLAATTNIGGAEGKDGKSKWRPEYARALKGKHVLILPDNDPPGRRHARVVAASLAGLAASVRVLELPGLPEKGDVSDWLARGGTLEQLKALARDAPAREAWTAKQDESEPLRVTRPRDAPAREDWTAELLTHGERYAKNDHNILVALRIAPELQGRFRLNLLAGTIEASDMPWRPGGEWLAWGDPDNHRLAAWLQKRGIDVRPTQVAGNVGTVADETRHDPVKDYLLALKWDGAERLSSWLVTHLGAHDAPAEYLRGVARAWAIAMVARALKPGCKADHILILEGPQGRLKSSALKALMPDEAWFSDEIATLGTKDSAQDLRGKWLIELSELSAMQRAEVERTKAALSRCVDHYRPSFGHYSQDFPRRNGFAGSTNHDAYLLDDTGNRRIWGVKVGTILLDAVKRDRDQLWAEAVHAFQAGEQWWLDPALEAQAAAEQAKRLEEDSWTHDVVTWGLLQVEPFSANDALIKALHLVDASKRDDKATKRVVRILRTNGFQHHRTKTARLWTKPGDAAPEPSPATVTEIPLDINAGDGMTVVTPDGTRAPAHARARHALARPGEAGPVASLPSPPSPPLKTNGNSVTPQGDAGIEPSPPWAADWPTWDGRCGADSSEVEPWLKLAGGARNRTTVSLPAACREHPEALKRLLSHITLQGWKVEWL